LIEKNVGISYLVQWNCNWFHCNQFIRSYYSWPRRGVGISLDANIYSMLLHQSVILQLSVV